MELWIRSQDKEKLIKTKNIEIQHYYSYKDAQEKFLLPSGSFEYRKVSKKDKYIESVIMCNDEICLGKYKSKERALEVLDEIQRLLHPTVFMSAEINTDDNSWVENAIIYQKYKDNFSIQELSTYVYEMPKD